MTSTIPTTYPRFPRGNLRPGEDITAEDWLSISRRSNWLTSRQVEIVPGIVEQMTTTSASYTRVNAAGRNLDTWHAPFLVARGDITLYAFGSLFNLKANPKNDGTLVTAVEAENDSATAGWEVASVATTAATALAVDVEIKATSGTATVEMFLITGKVLSEF